MTSSTIIAVFTVAALTLPPTMNDPDPATHGAMTHKVVAVRSSLVEDVSLTAAARTLSESIATPFSESAKPTLANTASVLQVIGASPANRVAEPTLARLIRIALLTAEIDVEERASAAAAAEDAVVMVKRNGLSGARVMFSEDGILTLQWQHADRGAALVFAGDQMASIAFRHPGQLYAENGIEVGITDPLPKVFAEALSLVAS